jgi:glutathione reductase (NADPH)
MPNIPGIEFAKQSDDFFDSLETLPKKAVLVGAGYIAVELAHVTLKKKIFRFFFLTQI